MSDEAKDLINTLFKRLKEAEDKSGARDDIAESQINHFLVQQPAAPYYMAQTIIMQEAALKQLNARVEQLEQQGSNSSGSGSFLSGLFGGHSTTSPKAQSGWTNPAPKSSYQDTPSRTASTNFQNHNQSGRASFLGGALQTAAGVAGGMVVGNMLMNMFGHHTSEEVVDIIQQPTPDSDVTAYTDTQPDNHFMGNDNASFDQSDLTQANWGDDQQQDDMDFDGGFDDFGDFT